MVETEVTIAVNRKSDIGILEQKIIERKIETPVYIQEYESGYIISFTSDYEQWELDTAILNAFPEYEYTNALGNGKKEIRIQISRHQSELSTDGWGRRIEDPINETKYLVKRSKEDPEPFSPKVKVLFEDQVQYYYVNIVPGIVKGTEKKGFLLLENFKTEEKNDGAPFFKDKLYKTSQEAFHYGCTRMSVVVENDFKLYLEEKKKAIRNTEKLPRKIIRDFIKACNSFDETALFKDLEDLFVYERRVNWQTVSSVEGLARFKHYLRSQEQQLCKRAFKIRSHWNINLPHVTIGVKYFLASDDPAKQTFQKFGQISFLLNNNKITKVIDEN